ncbi:uncharacterized protein FIESC28_10625 [Fusarium coffeatum]|uniref:Uncharacterized protein n=1 Tax=Fusarium coffeatum TaxID=231269 RepID=A0A366QRJ2_9HYPO|nr:uncharacterized protein FIESC28_10625 [Fusarium coffeatum]RBR07467.1 hypothetical protein FIESC28_10625 [Fusarium coffeatum]
MSATYGHGKASWHFQELPTEVKNLIMEEVSLLPESYKNLLNLAQTCKELCSHALSQLYLKDVRDSLRLGFDLNMPLGLQWACWFGVLEGVKMSLIENGVHPDAPDGKSLPPLAYSLNEDVVKFLIEKGANIDVTHGTDETALCHLISWGPRNQGDWQREFNVTRGNGALNPLDTRQDQLGAIRYLILNTHADIYANRITRVSPLLVAIQTRYTEVVQLLLDAGASPNPISTVTNEKRLLLADALRLSQNHCVVNKLLAFKAEAGVKQISDQNLTKKDGDQLPIMNLTTYDSNPRYAKEEVDMAEKICKEIKYFDRIVDGHPPLWHYVRKGRLDIGQVLIRNGASPQLAGVKVSEDILELVAD